MGSTSIPHFVTFYQNVTKCCQPFSNGQGFCKISKDFLKMYLKWWRAASAGKPTGAQPFCGKDDILRGFEIFLKMISQESGNPQNLENLPRCCKFGKVFKGSANHPNTFWISSIRYSCTAEGPRISKISCGSFAPSVIN